MLVDTAAGLTDALRRHRLLEPAQLAELDRLQAAFPIPRALAGELIRLAWLTPYQVNKLLQDRGRELLLGSYVLMERLGEGGMGEVFKARNWKLGQIVALKLIRKERIDNPDAVRRFQREIRAAAQLDHPNIVRAFDADEVGGTHLLVMEFVQGTDLSKLVKKDGPLPIEKACDYARQAALGLQHAFERGLVHRDIKPHNLLLTPQGVVKILDMGLARLDRGADDGASSTMTREGAVMGTLDYISPEQAMDSHDVDIRADLYSLGCTLYFLLTGKPPFPGGEALQKLLKHRLDEPIPVEQLRRDVPPGVAAVVRKLMAKRPDDRYQTPSEAAAALEVAVAATLSAEATIPAVGQAAPVRAVLNATVQTAIDGDTDAALRWVDERRRQRKAEGRRRIALYAVGGLLSLGLACLFVLLFLHFALPPAKPTGPPTPRSGPGPAPGPAVQVVPFDQWLKDTAALPAWRQGPAVGEELKKRNPGFDGMVKPTIEDGVVTGLEFVTDKVTDISPVRALTGLKILRCEGSGYGKGCLIDLALLKGMNLAGLYCNYNKISDLSPLKGMPLTALGCDGNQISNLGPLAGMELTFLNCGGNPITNLSPLKGMPLKTLWCHYSGVSDLTPLKGMPLTELWCHTTGITDLSPLKDMKLTYLMCHQAQVTDLSPLRGMPLQQIVCDFRPLRDAEILHSFKGLQQINGQWFTDFWKDVDKKQAAFETWCKEVAAVPAEKQWKLVAAKLIESNPGFDGMVNPVVEEGVVTHLQFFTDKVTDISPVRALPGLKSLNCGATIPGKGVLSDLSPLTEMRLTDLNIGGTRVSDLSPLKHMALTTAAIGQSSVFDLSPLKGMPLTTLYCDNMPISDLSPLKGMPLVFLGCANTRVTDLSPLKGMPLKILDLQGMPVSDLSPLKDIPLEVLNCSFTQVPTLSPLKHMPLTDLCCDQCKVTDLSPLKGMLLVNLRCDFDPKRDAEILRSLTTLEKINGQPAADFWKAVGDASPKP